MLPVSPHVISTVLRFLYDKGMRKPIFYYLAGILTVVAPIVLLWGLNLMLENALGFGGGGSNYDVKSTSLSPDGKFVATVYSAMGGGAAGWCSIRVTVNPQSEPFSVEREKTEGKYVVSTVSCGSQVETEWEGERNLLIAYTVPGGDSGISIYKKPVDWDGTVKIRYVEK